MFHLIFDIFARIVRELGLRKWNQKAESKCVTIDGNWRTGFHSFNGFHAEALKVGRLSRCN